MGFKKYLYSFLLPAFLLFHNPVDFTPYGATWCYKECLSHMVTSFANEMEEKSGIKLISYFGDMDNYIYSIGLHWELEGEATISSSRALLFDLMDAFLVRINEFKRLRPFLKCFPWTVCNITEMRIDFIDRCYAHYPSPGTISNISFNECTVTYNAEDPWCCDELIKVKDESYEQALRNLGWFSGARHRNRLLDPLPPLGDCEDMRDAVLNETISFYYFKKNFFETENKLPLSPFIQVLGVSSQISPTQTAGGLEASPIQPPLQTPAVVSQTVPYAQPYQQAVLPAQTYAQTVVPAAVQPYAQPIPAATTVLAPPYANTTATTILQPSVIPTNQAIPIVQQQVYYPNQSGVIGQPTVVQTPAQTVYQSPPPVIVKPLRAH